MWCILTSSHLITEVKQFCVQLVFGMGDIGGILNHSDGH